MIRAAAIGACCAFAAACADTTIVDPMERQPKGRAFAANAFFEDGRAMRTPPAGTVPRERIVQNPALTQGRVGGTDVFGLFLSIGYQAFYLTRTDVSIPRGRPVFPGVGTRGATPEEVMKKNGLVLRDTRMLDPSINCRVEEWGPRG